MTVYESLKERLIWAAAFYEGEGSISAHRSHGGVVHIQINQVQRWPVARMQEWFGGSLFVICSKRARQSDQWRWDASGERGVGIAMALYPLLSPKRQEQIRTALRTWRSYKTVGRKRHTCMKGHPYTPDNIYRQLLRGGRWKGRKCRACSIAYSRKRYADIRLKRSAANGQ